MNTRLLAFAGAALVALAAAPASAQPPHPAPAAAAPTAVLAASVGRWLYDERDEIVGGVKSLAPDGRTAVVALGVYFRDHVRLVEVPADALRVVDGKATLRDETVQALLGAPARRG